MSTDELLDADLKSNSIVVLNPTSGVVTLLLVQTDGIQYPWAVALCTTTKKLYVGRNTRQTSLSVFCQK